MQGAKGKFRFNKKEESGAHELLSSLLADYPSAEKRSPHIW